MARHFSPDVRVLLRPAATFRALAARPLDADRWLAWRRPLLFALLLGCTMSLTTTGSLTLRLVASAAISWSFVPAIQVAALAFVLRGREERRQLPRIVDLFCTGLSAWSLWLIGLCVIFTAFPQALAFGVFARWFDAAGILVLLWSAYVDYSFFREVLGRSPAQARRGLLLHRLMAWAPTLLIISQPAILPTLLSFAGR